MESSFRVYPDRWAALQILLNRHLLNGVSELPPPSPPSQVDLKAPVGVPKSHASKAKRINYRRHPAVSAYVVARAAGICECCHQPAPFHRRDGSPFLIPHHTRLISAGGPDDIYSVAAICPNCHAEIHFGALGEKKNEALASSIRERESNLQAGAAAS